MESLALLARRGGSEGPALSPAERSNGSTTFLDTTGSTARRVLCQSGSDFGALA